MLFDWITLKYGRIGGWVYLLGVWRTKRKDSISILFQDLPFEVLGSESEMEMKKEMEMKMEWKWR